MTQTITGHIPQVEKRKLVTSGNAVVLTVPKDWLEQNKLQAGDELLMVANGNLTFMTLSKENLDKVRNQLLYVHAGSPAKSTEETIAPMKR